MNLLTTKNGISVLNEAEIIKIIDTSLKILDQTGFIVENDAILSKLETLGCKINFKEQKAYFDKSIVTDFLKKVNHFSWEEKPQKYTSEAEIYGGLFLDPLDNNYKDWTQKHFLDYIKVAQNLPNINGAFMLGCPLVELPVKLQPLYEKLYCWKYGLRGGEAIWDTELCEPIFNMHEVYSKERKKEISELYNGVVYIISPLKLGNIEADQVMYFHERGLKTGIRSGGGSLGGSYPVTLAGAIAVWLAEHLAIALIEYVLYNKLEVLLSGNISAMDMSSGSFQYGRPEKSVGIIATAQIANYLKLEYKGHSGLSDSKIPGFEAAAQKLISTMYNVSACGNGNFVAGLLGTDEIFSPVQMILENELLGALNHISNGIVVNDETLAFEAINQAGAGGNFLSSEHTAINFMDCYWQPTLWSQEMYKTWISNGKQNDVDKARNIYLEIINNAEEPSTFITKETETELLEIIEKMK